MSRYWSTKCFVAVVMFYSAILFAGITKVDANSIVLNNIIGEDVGKVNVYASNYTVNPTKPVVLWSGDEVSTSYGNSWAYFVDDYPLGKWHHPCRIIFVNSETGEYEIFDKTIFPVNYETEFELISEIAKTDTPELPVVNTDQIEKALPNSNLYAVIINGSEHDEERFWNDMSAMYCTLIDVYGYTKENIIIHYSGSHGDDLDNDGINEYFFNADKAAIEATFAELELPSKLGPADQLFIYIDGHGYGSSTIPVISYIDLDGEDIRDSELADYVRDINCAQMIFTIGCCYSGGFTRSLNNTSGACKNISVHTASDNTMAYAEAWLTSYNYHEYFYYWIASVRGFYPGENPYDATYSVDIFPTDQQIPGHPGPKNPDTNTDTFVQMNEVFEYTNDFDTWSPYKYFNPLDTRLFEYPQNVSSTAYIDSLLTLKGLSGSLYLTPPGPTKPDPIEEPEIQNFTGNLMVNPQLTIKSGVYLSYIGDYTMTFVPDLSKWHYENGLVIEESAGFVIDGAHVVVGEGSQITMLRGSLIESKGNSTISGDIVVETGDIVSVNEALIRVADNSSLSLLNCTDLIIPEGTEIQIGLNSEFRLGNESKLTIKAGGVLRVNSEARFIIGNATNIVIEPGANVIFEPSAKLIVEGNAKITGTLTFPASTTAILQAGSILTVDQNSSLVLEGGAKIEAYENAEIFVERGGSFLADNNTIIPIEINYIPVTGSWKGINCDAETTVILKLTNINGALIGLSGIPYSMLITRNCSFEGCETAISILNCNNHEISYCMFVDCETAVSIEGCNNYEISYCVFQGMNKGEGIVLTQSSGNITRNHISNYDKGISVINSSPYIFNNTIYDNLTYGVYSAGYASLPQLIPLYTYYPPFNNTIKNNGLGNEDGAQICLDLKGMVYLNNGINNIYSEPLNVTPTVPCIKTLPEFVPRNKAVNPPNFKYKILAELNYWGSTQPSGSFFDLKTGYTIDFSPYSTADYPNYIPPFPNPQPGLPEPPVEILLLASAIEDEFNGKYIEAKDKYETLISEYSKTNEAMVAYAKLPNIYLRLGLDLNEINTLYDNVLASNEKDTNINFFKELKVSAFLKNKEYDPAIALAQEMMLAASSEGEAMLSQKDIDIANRLKGTSGKGGNITNGYETPSDITENILPTETVLYQNYPNPFNPVTQIKFALAKTSEVKLSVYNISGQKVAELAKGSKQAGIHTVDFYGSRFNSGVYYYTLEVEGISLTQKMILMK
ncbi:MAG: T9SS type A sorting domain-containing protein [Candidatus Delongbacteria bacterium]|nr:T9SS type A sorting domain-containing protein [Candidatus Delongbacteria bacterium]MCG2760306.1 T9SS type A sorting domain-containing protein [Candidatus Delongbacteria bacterium]